MTGRSDSTLSSETPAKVRELDDSAWQKMVDLYYPSVYAWCRQSGIDEHTAADVSQEICGHRQQFRCTHDPAGSGSCYTGRKWKGVFGFCLMFALVMSMFW